MNPVHDFPSCRQASLDENCLIPIIWVAYGIKSPFAVSENTVVRYSTCTKFRRLCSKEKLKQSIKRPYEISVDEFGNS